jgi:hypothetical protein
MAKRRPFTQSLAAAWLLFFAIVALVIISTFGGALQGAELAARGAPAWLRLVPMALGFAALVIIVRRMAGTPPRR